MGKVLNDVVSIIPVLKTAQYMDLPIKIHITINGVTHAFEVEEILQGFKVIGKQPAEIIFIAGAQIR